jgi:hypothetical protein
LLFEMLSLCVSTSSIGGARCPMVAVTVAKSVATYQIHSYFLFWLNWFRRLCDIEALGSRVMSCLRLYFSGSPHGEIEPQALQINRRKSLALLVHLAARSETQRRDTLATLFWPKTRKAKLRARLHRAVSHLHQMVGNAWLSIDREIVALVQNEEVEPAGKLLRRTTVCPMQAGPGPHTRSSTPLFDRTLYFGGAAYRSAAPI